MSIKTEQELITTIFGNDNTKTVQDVIELFAKYQKQTEDEIKDMMKDSDITDWSF